MSQPPTGFQGAGNTGKGKIGNRGGWGFAGETFIFEEFAAVFAGELGNVLLGELVEGFVEYGPARRRRRRCRSGVHGEESAGTRG